MSALKRSSPGDDIAVTLGRKALGPVAAAIHDDDPSDAGVSQIRERLFGHFSGTQQDRLLVVEPLENPSGEIGHGHAGNADAMTVDFRFGRHAPRHHDGRLENGVGKRPGGLARRSPLRTPLSPD